jgi:hypothetical protein
VMVKVKTVSLLDKNPRQGEKIETGSFLDKKPDLSRRDEA